MKKVVYFIMALVSLQSCREDFDFHEAYSENPEFVYRESFEKAYGEIDPDENWDFSEPAYTTRATRAAATGVNLSVVDKFSNYGNVRSYSTNHKGDWRKAGNRQPFTMTVPPNAFYMYPIDLETDGSSYWTMYIQVGSEDSFDGIPIFQRKKGEKNNIYGYDGTQWSVVYNYAANPTVTKGVRIELPRSLEGESMYIYIELDENSRGFLGANYGDRGDKITSLNDRIFTPSNVSINNMPAGKEYRIIGCEDSSKDPVPLTKDFKDIVFLMVGENKIPQISTITSESRGTRTLEYASKRYMVEDLGATAKTDIDFNDIVVDFETRTTIEYPITINSYGTITAGADIESTRTTVSTATVRALGGTKNISVYLSNNTTGVPSEGNDVCIFTKDKYGAADADLTVAYNTSYADGDNNCVVSGNLSGGLTASLMYNTTKYGDREQESLKNTDHHYDVNDYIAKINIAGVESTHQWSPSLNNVYVVVYEDISNPNYLQSVDDSHKTIRFPYVGDVPEMIATPISWDWNWERCGVFPDENGNYKSGSKVRLTKSAQ